MHLKIKIKEAHVNSSSKTKGKAFYLLTKLEKENTVLEKSKILFYKKTFSKRKFLDLLKVKYSSLFFSGLKVSVSDEDNEFLDMLKSSLVSFREKYPKTELVLSPNVKDFRNESILFSDLKISASVRPFTDNESVTISQIYLKPEKKIGLVMAHIKDGVVINSSNKLLNTGIVVHSNDLFDKIKFFLKDINKNANIYINSSQENEERVRFNDIEDALKIERPFSYVYKQESDAALPTFIGEIATLEYKKYFDSLNENLKKGSDTVIFTDGGRIQDKLGASTYLILSKSDVFNKTLLLNNSNSNFNEQIAALCAIRDVLTNKDKQTNKIHLVCDSDYLSELKKELDGDFSKLSDQVRKMKLFKEVKTLYKNSDVSFFFHYIKSHQGVKDFLSYGNDVVDQLNIIRLRKAIEMDKDFKLPKNGGYQSQVVFKGDISIDFYSVFNKEQVLKPNLAKNSYIIDTTVKHKPKKKAIKIRNISNG